MVCMNKLFNQQYFKYLYKSNRRLLILIWAILFICICFFTTIFTINDFTAYSEVQTFVTAMSGFCGISISMFVPIYFFRFLYRKRSCDLYFGLPIRKKELFSTTFLFGYLAILIPIAVYFLSTSIIASQFMNVLSSTILMNIKIMGFFAIFMLCIQAIICFLCIRCNTMMDALFISGTYVILPFILYISMNIFLKEQVNVITLGYGNYIEYIFNTDTILTFLSLPYAALRNVAYLFDYSPDWLSIFYWIILCAIALYFAYHYFINRKAEDSEQRTTFWLGYSFIILIVTFCMILAVQTARGVSLLVGLTIIFFMYLFLVFFSKRKIVLNIKTITVFVGLLIGSAAFGQAFQYTHGFGVVQELPQLEKVSSVNIEVVMSQEINHNKTTINGLSLVGKTKNETLNKSIYELHNDVLDVCTDKHEGGSTQITFLYTYRNGRYMSRTYSIGDAVTKGIILPKFDEYHEEAKQGKINASVDYTYTVSNDVINY